MPSILKQAVVCVRVCAWDIYPPVCAFVLMLLSQANWAIPQFHPVFKVTWWCALLEQLESPHLYNYSAFICGAATTTRTKARIGAENTLPTVACHFHTLHTNTHLCPHMRMRSSAPPEPTQHSGTHSFFLSLLFLFGVDRIRARWGFANLSLRRCIEPVINYWIQRYLWDVQMPVQICLSHCAIMCVGSRGLSVPAPFILNNDFYIT